MNPILSKIHPGDIYSGFTAKPEAIDGWGGGDPIFAQLVNALRPEVIIEVGTWKGQSAITMAESCRGAGLKTAIICVDTWLGSEEHILGVSATITREHGYPTLYHQFLSNVVNRGVQEFIVPLPAPSSIASHVLAKHGISANLIYLDADHQFESVLADLEAFYPLLKNNGTMFGHDYNWESVRRALQQFCTARRLSFYNQDFFWIIKTA